MLNYIGFSRSRFVMMQKMENFDDNPPYITNCIRSKYG